MRDEIFEYLFVFFPHTIEMVAASYRRRGFSAVCFHVYFGGIVIGATALGDLLTAGSVFLILTYIGMFIAGREQLELEHAYPPGQMP